MYFLFIGIKNKKLMVAITPAPEDFKTDCVDLSSISKDIGTLKRMLIASSLDEAKAMAEKYV